MGNRLGWCVSIAVAAYTVAAGTPLEHHNSDSLIPIYVSLEHWTPFYWGQDRFGMLIPLLASPVRDGLANLLVQNALSLTLLLVGIAALARRIGVLRPSLLALGTLALLLPFGASNLRLLLLTTNQSYAPACGLFLLGLSLLMNETRLTIFGGVVAILLGTWTNAGVALFAGCVGVAFLLFSDARSRPMRLLLAVVAGLLFHRLLQAMSSAPLVDVTSVRPIPFGEFGNAIEALGRDTLQQTGSRFVLCVLGLWIVALSTAIVRPAQSGDRLWLLAVCTGSAAYAIAMAGLFHGLGRHMAPVFVVAVLAPLTVLTRTPVAGFRGLSIAVLAVVVLQTGVPNPANLRQRLVASLGQGRAEVAYGGGVVAVTGDYWDVWPITFATNLMHEQATGARRVLPVTLRSEVMVRTRATQISPGSAVLVVPSGHLQYWRMYPELPPLAEGAIEFGNYHIIQVADTSRIRPTPALPQSTRGGHEEEEPRAGDRPEARQSPRGLAHGVGGVTQGRL